LKIDETFELLICFVLAVNSSKVLFWWFYLIANLLLYLKHYFEQVRENNKPALFS